MVVLGLVAPQLVLAGLARSQERQLVELAQLEFDGLTAALAPLVPRDDVWEMFDLLDRLTRRDSGLRPVAATLVDPMGRVVVSSHPEAWPLGAPAQALVGAAVPVEAFRYDAPAREVTVRAVLTHQGRPLGQMVIAFDASALLAERARATRAMLLGNLATTLLLAGAAWLAVRRLMRPMTRLIDQMGGGAAPPQAIPPADLPPGDGEVSRLYRSYNAMIRALDERNAAERQLAERERFVSLGRLAGTLAHEVNNPVGGLMNAANTLRRYPDRPEVVTGSADLLDRGLRHLRDVVRATLSTQRGTEGEVALSPLDLEDLRVLIQPEAERNGQRLDWELRAAAPCLAGLPAGPARPADRHPDPRLRELTSERRARMPAASPTFRPSNARRMPAAGRATSAPAPGSAACGAQSGLRNRRDRTPTMPWRNISTVITKMAPWMIVTQAPKPAR